jgi:translation initiation factor IF-2
MTDTKTTGDKTVGDKTISVGAPKTLTIKRPMEQSTVRQSFSHGRSKQVVVEVKRRIVGPGSPETKEPSTARAPAPAPVAPAAPAAPLVTRPVAAPASVAPPPPRPQSGMVLRTLSDDEKDARTRALADARVREADEREQAMSEASQRAEREERERRERDAAQARQREEEDRKRQEDDRKRRGEDEARRRLGEEIQARAPRPEQPPAPPNGPRMLRDSGARPPRLDGPRPASTRSAGPKPRPVSEASTPAVTPPPSATAPRKVTAAIDRSGFDDESGAKGVKRGVALKPSPAVKTPKVGGDKSRGRLTVGNALNEDSEKTHSIAAFRRRMQRMTGHRDDKPKEKITREVIIPETITISELANRMSERGVDVIRLLMKQGQMMKITDVIDADTAQLIAEEMGHSVKRVAESDVEEGLFDTPDAEEALVGRAPVVTIMGHVDHGKTSLLDALRKTSVVSGEAGGITQHIGAYQVASGSGGKITFIDTPGHAAFTAMRARGAKVTDIVVLVVAADDGVMPQTVEAINHAKAAKVPLIVAINKIDKPEAKPERVRSELLQYEIQVESLGGDTLEIEVSAKQGTGLDKLLEAILLQSEVLDLKANPTRTAEGTIIEAKLDRGRGPVATALVQRGSLHPGDIVVAGAEWGKVRALINDKGDQVKEAGPSMPVEVLGFSGVPEAGDRIAVVESEARAREITSYRQRAKRDKAAARMARGGKSLSDMMQDLKAGAGRKEFPLLVKGDVQGSVEAIIGALEKAGNDEVQARVLLSGVGGITESDITLAQASGAAVLGFNVRAHKEARELAEQSGTEIRYYNIIYDLVDDIKAAMSGLLAPTLRETLLGTALMLEIFNVSKVGKIAGCRVTDGTIERGANVRLIRDNVVIHEGKLSTLKRFKDDVKEVPSGQECGVAFENFQDMRAGDTVECFRVEEIKRSL